jgi:hypothetical protein
MRNAIWLGLAFSLLPRLAGAVTDTDLSSGGVAPPPPVEAPPVEPLPTETERDLERADREDAGRGLEFVWLNGEFGFQHLGLQTFHANDLVDAGLVKSTQSGPVFGAGAGVRLIFLTLGARFRLGSFDAWQLWTLNAELGIRIPLGSLEPYFTFGGGYAALGSFDSASLGGAIGTTNGLDVSGFDVRGGFGLDYYIGRYVSLGANVSGDLLVLSRPKVEAAATAMGTQNQAAAEVYSRDGSSIGAAVTVTAVAGLHF